MKVSVIIPAIREVNQTALDALNKQSFKDFEIVIVKGVSPNGKARNEGVRSAKGYVYVFIDDDAVLAHENVLKNILQPLFDKRADIVGASRRLPEDSSWFAKKAAKQLPLVETPIVNELTPANPQLIRENWMKNFLKHPFRFFTGSFDQSVWAPITTTCVAMPADIYRKIGGFNEELWWGVDSEFFYRAAKNNIRMVLAPNAWVYHPYVSNIRGLWKKYFKSGIGTAHEMKLHPERNIQPPLNSIKNVLWFVLYRVLGFIIFLFIKPIRALASLFSMLGYMYGWFTPKEHIVPTEAGSIDWSRLPFWLLLVSVLVSPLSYRGTIEIGFTLKISEVLLIVAILSQLWFYVQRKNKNHTWYQQIARDPVLLIFLGYFLVAAVSLTRAINVERGILVLIQTLILVCGLVLLPQAITPTISKVKALCATYVFASLAASIFGIIQFFANYLGLTFGLRETYVKARAGYPRIHATFLEPLYMAHYLLAAIAIKMNQFVFSSEPRKHVAGLFVLLLGLNLGFSRGGWLGFLVSLGVLGSLWVLVKMLFRVSVSMKRLLLLGGIITVSFAAIPVSITIGKGMYAGVGQYIEEYQRLRLENKIKENTASAENIEELERIESNRKVTKERVENSPLTFLYDRFGRFFTLAVGSRIDAWEAAITFVSQSPLIGVGVGNFGYQERGVETGYEGLNFVNNQPLEILAETGVLGFLFYVLLNGYWIIEMLRTVFAAWKTNTYEIAVLATGLFAGYMGIMTQFLTVSNWNVFHYWFILGLGFVIARLPETRR